MSKMTLILCLLSFQVFGQQKLTETPPASTAFTEKIYTLADRMASFPGGYRSWSKYLEKNLDFAIPTKNNAPAGRYNVIVVFIIDEKGNVNEVKPLTKHGFGMEEELIRIIEKGPRWSPAIEKGKTVKSYRKQPLIFVVSKN